MNDTDAHMVPLEWLIEDAVMRGDVDHAEQVTRMISLYHLKEDHPDVYDLLMGMEKRTRDRAMQPQQIGQLVAKQDNNFMMGRQLEGVLKVLLPKLTQDND